jgi:hypothetical protein
LNHWHWLYKPLQCSICICSFVDLQHFAIISYATTTQVQYFCFMLYVYPLPSYTSNIPLSIILATTFSLLTTNTWRMWCWKTCPRLIRSSTWKWEYTSCNKFSVFTFYDILPNNQGVTWPWIFKSPCIK